jgi:hypothetical protein
MIKAEKLVFFSCLRKSILKWSPLSLKWYQELRKKEQDPTSKITTSESLLAILREIEKNQDIDTLN